MELSRPEREVGEVERLEERGRGKMVIRAVGSSEVLGKAAWREEERNGHAYLYLFGLGIFDRSNRGKGFSSQLIDAFEDLCRERGMTGVVEDGISEHESPQTVGMYSRRVGWVPIPESKDNGIYYSFVYNLQPGQTPSDFSQQK